MTEYDSLETHAYEKPIYMTIHRETLSRIRQIQKNAKRSTKPACLLFLYFPSSKIFEKTLCKL